MELNKKIGRNGTICIPASLRRSYGIAGGERVTVSVNAQGSIIIQRIIGSCVFCESDQNVTLYGGRYICNECVEKIKKI